MNSLSLSQEQALSLLSNDEINLLPFSTEVDAALYLEELKLEHETMIAARENYFKAVNEAEDKGTASETSYGRKLLANGVVAIADYLQKWMDSSTKGAGRKHTAIKPLQELGDLRVVAAISLSCVINACSKKEQARTGIAFNIASKLLDELNLRIVREFDKTLFKKMESAAANKGSYSKKQDAVNYLARLNDYERVTWSKNLRVNIGTLMIDVITQATGLIEQRLMPQWSSAKHSTETPWCVALTDNAYAMIQKHKDIAADFNTTYRPMVVPPIDWTKGMVRGGAYLTNFVTPLRLVKTHSHRTLYEYANVDMPHVLNAINAAQRTPWRINHKVLELLRQLPPSGVRLKKLNLHEPEQIQKPDDIAQLAEAYKAMKTVEDYEKQNEQRLADGMATLDCPVQVPAWFDEVQLKRYMDYRKQSTAYWKQMQRVKSYNRSYSDIVEMADRFKEFERIYMPYTLDFRGRIYCASLLSPQGADHVKALLQFADAERVGKDGIKWLKLHAANLMGDDKAPFAERIQWAEDNWEEMVACARDPFQNRMWSTADKPLQAYATCLEILGVEENGEDHICRMPIALDGSCSGIQIFSAMLQDEIGGAAVNLVPAERPSDIYTMVKNKVQEALENDSQLQADDLIDEWLDGNNEAKRVYRKNTREQIRQDVYLFWLNPNAVINKLGKTKMQEVRECARYASAAYHSKQWLNYGINRSTAKRPVMTFPYGARKQGFKDQVMDDVLKPAHTKHIEKYGDAIKGVNGWCFDGTGYASTSYLAEKLWDGVSMTVLKAAEMMEWLRAVAALIVKAGMPIHWFTPLGFYVVQDYRKQDDRTVKCMFEGKKTYVNINSYKAGKKFVDNDWEADIDKNRSVLGISPNVIHSLDSTLLMLIVSLAKAEGIDHFALIHDSFGTTAAKTERFYMLIREAFVKLFTDWNVLEIIAQQLIAQVPEEYQDQIPPLPEKGTLDLDLVKQSVYCFL
ncbi:TPA: DNA-directed RNA polymerase [Photobacterium damselae]